MSKATAIKKAQQLGMPFGTAQARLLKRLLFRMAQELERDTCYRCSKRIETVEDFSVEHKVAWLDVSATLFWDLDNIAFSHLKCNISAVRRSPEKLRAQLDEIRVDHVTNAPEGTAWCYGHKNYVPKERFNANKWFPSGVQRYCQECRSRGIGRKKVKATSA